MQGTICYSTQDLKQRFTICGRVAWLTSRFAAILVQSWHSSMLHHLNDLQLNESTKKGMLRPFAPVVPAVPGGA